VQARPKKSDGGTEECPRSDIPWKVHAEIDAREGDAPRDDEQNDGQRTMLVGDFGLVREQERA
jgi:hypothetical protein